MSVKIRLTRTGSRNAACFRVVAADSRFPRDGRYLENLGWYDPKMTGANFKLKTDRIAFWRSQGAEISDTVASLLKQSRKADAEGGVTADAATAAAALVEAAPEPAAAAPEAGTEPAVPAEAGSGGAAEEEAAQ
jgi:small subunit ribosomal protein S16